MSTKDEITYRVMHLLETTPDLTQRELATRIGISVGAINYCVNALIDKGWVKMHNFAHSKNKFKYAYLLTPKGVVEKSRLTRNFLARKLAEYERLKNEIEELQALASNDLGEGAAPSK
jgi:EPS-associated MarR family transcriptional regulator